MQDLSISPKVWMWPPPHTLTMGPSIQARLSSLSSFSGFVNLPVVGLNSSAAVVSSSLPLSLKIFFHADSEIALSAKLCQIIARLGEFPV